MASLETPNPSLPRAAIAGLYTVVIDSDSFPAAYFSSEVDVDRYVPQLALEDDDQVYKRTPDGKVYLYREDNGVQWDEVDNEEVAQDLFPQAPPVLQVPNFLRKSSPSLSDLFYVDAGVPLQRFLVTLSAAGYTVINNRDGKLVITHNLEAWRP